ncbi:type II secretion system major pseudopilin GspG [Candidatus Dependentiae bacterium]|nr:type II secretion system major pseudopilin GspG [Candidatus Dependentiae bacterium]
MTRNKQEAFTLMEIMIAMVVLGILATLAIPGVMRMREKIRVNQTKAVMASLETAINDYREDIGHFPTQQEGGLEALVVRPRGPAAQKWDGPYLKGKTELPQDAWGNDYELNLGAAIKNKAKHKYYEIISYGPAGPEDEKDIMFTGE